MIKGIILDLDGVYFTKGKESFINNMSRKFKISKEKIIEIFLKSDMMNQKYKNGKIAGKEFWNYAIKEWDIKANPKEILKLMLNGYKENDAALELIRELKSKNLKIIACSNNFKERIELLDKKFKFLKNFDYKIFSYEFGIQKPELFKKVLEKTKLLPKEILILDDRGDLIESAKKMGFKAEVCEKPEDVQRIILRNI